MVLISRVKIGQKNRFVIPSEYFNEAGFEVGGEVYVIYEEGTNRIVIQPKKETNDEKERKEL